MTRRAPTRDPRGGLRRARVRRPPDPRAAPAGLAQALRAGLITTGPDAGAGAGTVTDPGAADDAGVLGIAVHHAAVRAAQRQQGTSRPAALLDVVAAATGVLDELVGAGPLSRLLREPGVSDVVVNGTDGVWVDRGAGLRRTVLSWEHPEAVTALAVRLVTAAGGRLDPAAPVADVVLPGGVRLHAVLGTLTGGPTLLSLRVGGALRPTLPALVAAGTLTGLQARWLRALLRAGSPVLITGGTGSGKTTLLTALLSAVGPHERLLLIEDTAELRPLHPHVVRLTARAANSDGAGAVDLRALVRAALRMRPDRLVLGEARGAELVDLLVAANAGHRGTLLTLHANSAADVPARLAGLGALAGLRPAAVAQLAASALRVVAHLDRDSSGQRRLRRLAVLQAGRHGGLRVRTVSLTTPGGDRAAPAGRGRAALVAELRRAGIAVPRG